MAELRFRLPDVGEGIAEAEVVEWFVAPGDRVRRDQPVVEVLTDKATIEISSPADATVLAVVGSPGDRLAIGAELVVFDVDGDVPVAADPPAEDAEPEDPSPGDAPVRSKALAAPTVRRRAREAGIELTAVVGTGPGGRVVHADLDRAIESPTNTPGDAPRTVEVPVVGVRRRIAERMTTSASTIPHITYVEEVDVTDLLDLRTRLNDAAPDGAPRLTLLPFVVAALVRAVAEHPQCNATFDDAAGVLHQHLDVHVGIATQTPVGLVVPVLRDAGPRDLWDSAAEIARLAEAARAGTATAAELSGSSITISSLGALGGLMTTPIINPPEVAVIGVNKTKVEPVWDGEGFVPRTIMRLSSSFDHRIVDGWEAAELVQRIRGLLEHPLGLLVPLGAVDR